MQPYNPHCSFRNIKQKPPPSITQENQIAFSPYIRPMMPPAQAPAPNRRTMPRYEKNFLRSFLFFVTQHLQNASAPLRISPMHMVLA